MPNLHLTKDQVQALTTFLLGSQESSLPDSYQYKPGDARHDIQEGWWVVKKYNCMGCHQFYPGQRTVLKGLKQYQEVQEQLPPKLLTEGARVSPEWFAAFPVQSRVERGQTPIVTECVPISTSECPLSSSPIHGYSDALVRFFQAPSQQWSFYTTPGTQS